MHDGDLIVLTKIKVKKHVGVTSGFAVILDNESVFTKPLVINRLEESKVEEEVKEESKEVQQDQS